MKRLFAALTGLVLLLTCLTAFAQADETKNGEEVTQGEVSFLNILGVQPDGSLIFEEVDPSDAPSIIHGETKAVNADWLKAELDAYDDPDGMFRDIMTAMFMINSLESFGQNAEGGDVSFQEFKDGMEDLGFVYTVNDGAYGDYVREESGVTWTIQFSPQVQLKLFSQGVKAGDSQETIDRKLTLVGRGKLSVSENQVFDVSFLVKP